MLVRRVNFKYVSVRYLLLLNGWVVDDCLMDLVMFDVASECIQIFTDLRVHIRRLPIRVIIAACRNHCVSVSATCNHHYT